MVTVMFGGRGRKHVAERSPDGRGERDPVPANILKPRCRRELVAQDSALPWVSGIGQYRTSLRLTPVAASLAKRAWLRTAALGADVEPEVNSKNIGDDGAGSSGGRGAPV
jgi:hypothetical protein